MKTKRILTNLVFALLCSFSVSIMAQTPYDSFAPTKAGKQLGCETSAQFEVSDNVDSKTITFSNKESEVKIYSENRLVHTASLSPMNTKFISVDPMADKYPGWGAYVYCYNNPLEYFDPNGEEVWIVDPNDPDIEYQLMNDGTLQDVDGNTLNEDEIEELDDFFKDVIDAAEFLFDYGVGDNLKSAINSTEHIKLFKDDFNSRSNNNGSVTWAPDVGILTFTTENLFKIPTVLPPCISLEHEFDHRMNSINKEKDPNKRLAEEHRVISGTETQLARKLELIGTNQEIVSDYSNRYSRFSIGVMGPTSKEYSQKKTNEIVKNYEKQGRTTDVYKHYRLSD